MMRNPMRLLMLVIAGGGFAAAPSKPLLAAEEGGAVCMKRPKEPQTLSNRVAPRACHDLPLISQDPTVSCTEA